MANIELVYVDTSAYVKRFAREPGSDELNARITGLRIVSSVLVWPELMSAVARKLREGGISQTTARTVRSDIREHLDGCVLVRTNRVVLEEAERLLFSHRLRASDAIHLGSAVRVAMGRPEPLPFLTADVELSAAATDAGLAVETFGV